MLSWICLLRIHGHLSPRCNLPKAIGEQEITGLPGPLIKSRGKICAETYWEQVAGGMKSVYGQVLGRLFLFCCSWTTRSWPGWLNLCVNRQEDSRDGLPRTLISSCAIKTTFLFATGNSGRMDEGTWVSCDNALMRMRFCYGRENH